MYKIKSIQNKMMILIIVFMIIPMTILLLLTLKNTEKIVSKKAVELTSNTLLKLNSNFQNIIDNMIVVSNVIVMDKDIISALNEGSGQNKYDEYVRTEKVINKAASSLGIIIRYNCQISIIDNDMNLYTTWNRIYNSNKKQELIESKWFKETVDRNGRILWTAPHDNYISLEGGLDKHLISLSRLIKGDKGTGGYGVLLLSIYLDEIEKNFDSILSSKEGFIITNNDGEIICKNSFIDGVINDMNFKQLINRAETTSEGSFNMNLNEENMQIVYKELENIGWKSIYIIPYDDMQKEVSDLTKKNISMIIIIFLIFMLITVFLSLNISKPIKKLIIQMNKIKEGNLNLEVAVFRKDEVGQLTENFNKMLKDIKNLMNEVNAKEKEKKEAHLAALQAQINPHFLFNTLNAIKWNAYVNGIENVGDMVAELGKLFEIVIARGSEFITIKEEIEYIKSYIKLMGFRTNKKIEVSYEIDNEVMDLYTLKFILQPIIENSIIHGLDGITDAKLNITIVKEENNVLFTIYDNGKGISDAKIEKLLNENKNSDSNRLTGIGLSNVNERIKLNFGNNYGIKIHSSENRGTKVDIAIPIIDILSEGYEN